MPGLEPGIHDDRPGLNDDFWMLTDQVRGRQGPRVEPGHDESGEYRLSVVWTSLRASLSEVLVGRQDGTQQAEIGRKADLLQIIAFAHGIAGRRSEAVALMGERV